MDYETLDQSLTDIEAILGIDEFSKSKPITTQIDELNRKLKDELGANLLYSIAPQKLESLHKIATETSCLSGNLAEKVESIKFSENLINHRIELVKQFEECLGNALDSASFSRVAELQPQLDEEIRICEELLEKWKGEREEFVQFREEYSEILQKISQRLVDVEKKITFHKLKRENV
ncbi:unnamed protein product [Caenorhabditis angaria]|uniref:Uncharacterized protein n=1 Tax=Caenorhabditis angaria TaxID=860376 RepID=A0A9P1I9C2_9PELO|nr:unnamed protein product [Caenorhabditis angaria]